MIFRNLLITCSIISLIVFVSCKKDDFVNSNPTIAEQIFSLDENSPEGTIVGTIKGSDINSDQELVFSIISGNSDDAFALTSKGELTVNNSEVFDFEVREKIELEVKVDDGFGGSSTGGIVISILNVNEIPTNGLVAFYPFNGNADDESVNKNDGTVSGTTLTEDRNANANSAYSFDGIDDYIVLGDDFDQESNSINVWFKIADIMIFEAGETIIASDHANKVNGLWSITLRADTENPQSPQLRFNRNGNVNLNPIGSDWYMATLTFDGSEYKYYVNGVMVNSGFDQGNINSKDGIPFSTVGTSRKFDRYFNGLIDDIRIYSRALDVNEIITIYREVE
jgi:hypothetical protein